MDPEELKLIRQANFRRWINEDAVAAGDVKAWCDHYSKFLKDADRPFNPSYIRQLVPKHGPPHASFGEKVARKIERAMGQPEGSLDRPPNAVGGESPGYREQIDLVEAFRDADEERQLLARVLLGLAPESKLPEGAGDALRLACKLASPGRRGSDNRTAA